MNSNRQRPDLERACKKREPEAAGSLANGALGHLELSPKLWRELPTQLAYKVLSYLHMDTFVDTLRHVNRNFLTSPGFCKIFGHGDNLLSSYGFVLVPNREVPRLTAFEHESMQWREFPKMLPAELKQARLISGGNDGLLMLESKKCSITNLTYEQMAARAMDLCLFSPDIGVWNPFLHSFKWLPAHPQQRSSFRSVVMVDEPSKTYKVFLQYRNFSPINDGHYSVYNSISGTWSCCKLIPTSVDYLCSASCGRYIVFGDAYESYQEDSLWCYDVQRDSWDRFFPSQMLTDLDCSSHGAKKARIDSFAFLCGILYMLIYGTSEGIILASIDLSSAETPTMFKLETIVPVPSFPYVEPVFETTFNIYTYTLKCRGFVCVRTSTSPNHFRHFDVSKGDWLASDKFPDLARNKGWRHGGVCFSFHQEFRTPLILH